MANKIRFPSGGSLVLVWVALSLLASIGVSALGAKDSDQILKRGPVSAGMTDRQNPIIHQSNMDSNRLRSAILPMLPEELDRQAAHVPDRVPLGVVPRTWDKPMIPSALSWSFIGPRPVENEAWSGYDDASGRICAFLFDPGYDSTVYLAAAQGGVWKTVNDGSNWAPLTDHLSSLSSGDLAFDPYNSNIVYYGTGELHYATTCCYGDGLFKTTNAGATWVKIATKAQVGAYISRIVVSPIDPDIIHLGGSGGYLRSTDGGANWTPLITTGHCNDIVADPTAPGTIYIAIYGDGIYKSPDDGITTDPLTNGLPTELFARINLAICQSSPNVLYASYIDMTGGNEYRLKAIYKTTNGGANWSPTATKPPTGQPSIYNSSIIVDRSNPDICYVGGVELFKTIDGGATWDNITVGVTGTVHIDMHCLAWANDGALWVGSDGGVWKTTDGGVNWENLNHTLGITQFYSVGMHPSNPNFLLGGTQDQGAVRFDGFFGWPQLNSGDGGPCAVEWDSPNIYYTTYLDLTILKWDAGVFQGDVTGPWVGERVSWVRGPLEVDGSRVNTLLAGTYRVWRTMNSAGSWTPISGDLTAGDGRLFSLAVIQDTIYAGSSDGLVHVTTDAANWVLRNTGLPASGILDIFADPTNWRNAYLCLDRWNGGRIYHTTDGGVSGWTNVTGDLPEGLHVMALAVHFDPIPPRLFVGTDYGVYSSSNNGVNWVKNSAFLPSMEICDLGLDLNNDLLTAATHGRGMYQAAVMCYATGDCDGDGTPLTVSDAVHFAQVLAGTAAPVPPLYDYDLNGDCVINNDDYTVMEDYFIHGYAVFIPYGGYPVPTCCDVTSICPAPSVDYITQAYMVIGHSNGVGWSWCINGPGYSLCDLFVPGVPASGDEIALVNQWVNSINSAGCPDVTAVAYGDIFTITVPGTTAFSLCVGSYGLNPTCCIPPAGACGFNPDVNEFPLSGEDCNENQIDDAIDIATGSSPDENNNSIPDECECDCGVWGDVTGEGEINPIDVVYMVNFVYKNDDQRTQPPNCPHEAGDVNCDEEVNPIDVVHYVNYVYKNITPWPCENPCAE